MNPASNETLRPLPDLILATLSITIPDQENR